MLPNEIKQHDRLLSGLCKAGMSEWQTRQTQNLLPARACGFESHRRHEEREPCIIQDSHFFVHMCISLQNDV